MADDLRSQIARVEERVDLLTKRMADHRGDIDDRLDRTEDLIDRRAREVSALFDRRNVELVDTVKATMTSMEKMLRELIDARLEVQEARNSVVRWIAFGIAGGVLVAFLNALIGGLIGTHPVKFPTAPPYHSSEEVREK